MSGVRTALIGSRGMLAHDVKSVMTGHGFEIIPLARPDFDICNASQIEDAVADSDIVINCAAYTAVDKAESEKELCAAVNAESCRVLADSVKKHGKYLIHISTDFVFGDDSISPLSEDSPVNPLNTYGLTKLQGEKYIQESGCSAAVIRVEWTYGINGVNFVTKMLELAKKLDTLKVVGDQFGAPTHTLDIAKAVKIFAEKRIEGLYHYAAKGAASRYDVAKFIFAELGIVKNVLSCRTSDFQTPAKRPLNSRFDCSRIDEIPGIERPLWNESLRGFLEKYFARH